MHFFFALSRDKHIIESLMTVVILNLTDGITTNTSSIYTSVHVVTSCTLENNIAADGKSYIN